MMCKSQRHGGGTWTAITCYLDSVGMSSTGERALLMPCVRQLGAVTRQQYLMDTCLRECASRVPEPRRALADPRHAVHEGTAIARIPLMVSATMARLRKSSAASTAHARRPRPRAMAEIPSADHCHRPQYDGG